MIGHSNAGERAASYAEPQGISLPRFARLLALSVLGLAALLSLGVRGVVSVQGRLSQAAAIGIQEPAFPSRHKESTPPRANVRHGSGASTKTAAGRPSTNETRHR